MCPSASALILAVDLFPARKDPMVDSSAESVIGGDLIAKHISTLTWSPTSIGRLVEVEFLMASLGGNGVETHDIDSHQSSLFTF